MGDQDTTPEAATDLPEPLVELLDTLTPQQLQAVSAYVEQRLSDSHAPTAREIRDDAEGKIVDITPYDAYTLVWKQIHDTAVSPDEAPVTSLYTVQRVSDPDGETTLHWTYLGDLRETDETTCENCGSIVGPHSTRCHQCGIRVENSQEGEEDAS